ncbi:MULTISPECIES: CopG family transcriptional regulator [Streptococcus]|uniref:CopG family transcriptional regulator n=1 Tax=Streptococcus suis TaxID=1307 RepID=A0A0Z8FXN2_STRSU|nr:MULTISPECIES: CopG family transcriptional regulator [Streptococcus]AUC92145.1 CopG family transcriptional regulator [Streptococcus suis]MBY4966872.1 hypothetical protein [Streptococcus suis]MBY4970794.1 hypothetical protein [Streptococcus suis]MCK3953153.1 CopG family transcriptional regulator [Streptococcus suis]MCK3955396.1 CopG family transcriptional regulator [Streptococcus suis]
MADNQKSNKDTVIRARVDSKTVEQLEYIEKKTNRKKSEVIRDGIQKIYDEIKK